MEQRESQMDSHVEGAERGLRELTSKWFLDTQLPLIIHKGFFPAWFLGFITRKDAEEILCEKELGCFLIRLRDNAIGYVLSYKGKDRFRHFVINQNESGQFVVCGDTTGHDTVSDLIEYYRKNPIEPYREYLTFPCFETLNEEVYDTIQVKEKTLTAVGAAKNTQTRQANLAAEQLPTRPPKSNRTLLEVPPLPRRIRHLDNSLLNDQDKILYAQLMKQAHKETPEHDQGRSERLTAQHQNIRRCSPLSLPVSVYSELSLLDNRSRSLPLLDSTSDGEQSSSLSAPPHTPPRLSPKPVRNITYYEPPAETTVPCSRPSSSRYSSLEYMNDSAVYHLAGRPGSPHTTASDTKAEQHRDSLYAEVPSESLFGRVPHISTYERHHGDVVDRVPSSNTYEPVEDIRPKHSSWGLKNDKWKWLMPEVKRKW